MDGTSSEPNSMTPEITGDPVAGRRILLGVTGGIAAYKSVELARRLVDRGAYVIPVMTKNAERFIGRATLSALSSEPVHTEIYDDSDPIVHTRLARECDLIVVAPATARLLGEYAAGISRDLLMNTLLASEAPVILCPAMHHEMWGHPATRENVTRLRGRGVTIVAPEHGRLAGGDLGEGRLAETETILAAISERLGHQNDLAGYHVVVSAGGTREAIDPVRFLSNHSSGRQGYAIARAARARGARVSLVTTVDLEPPVGVETIEVVSAEDLNREVMALARVADVVVMAAAVADFRPERVAPQKLKKADGPPEFVLVPTIDTLAELGRHRRTGQIIVGFAAETQEVERNAQEKLIRKGADLMVVNDVTREGVGFTVATNAVTILDRDGGRAEVPLAPKSTIAHAVLDRITELLGEKLPSPTE